MGYRSKRGQTTQLETSRKSQENEFISLKGFVVNHLSHDCHINIDGDVPTAYCRSSSVFQLFNNRLKLGRTKKLIAFLELSFWPLKLRAKAVKICLNFTRARVVKIVADHEDRTLNWE